MNYIKISLFFISIFLLPTNYIIATEDLQEKQRQIRESEIQQLTTGTQWMDPLSTEKDYETFRNNFNYLNTIPDKSIIDNAQFLTTIDEINGLDNGELVIFNAVKKEFGIGYVFNDNYMYGIFLKKKDRAKENNLILFLSPKNSYGISRTDIVPISEIIKNGKKVGKIKLK